MIIPVEVWLPIAGFLGYEVSDLGNVRSFRSPNGRGGLKTYPTMVKGSPMKGKPYLQVTLGKGNGQFRQTRVHVLVLETFIGARPSRKHEGCHNDGNARNNAKSNLRWGTKEDNTSDRLKHGTQVKGDKSPNTKLTDSDVVAIRLALQSGVSGSSLANQYGVGTSSISRINKRQTWGHI